MQLNDILSPHQDEADDFVVPSIDQMTGSVVSCVEQVNDFPVFPPAKTIDLMSLQDVVQKLNDAVKVRKYPEAIIHATVAIDSQFSLNLFDVRAFCYAMHGQKSLAIADAQRMIEFWPSRATGYLRKGGILSLYGQQAQAIEAFDEGLRNTTGFESSQIRQLKRAKEAATNLNAARVNFITQLPVAPVNDILSRLPLATIATCLTISKIWRHKTLGYENLWRDLSICDDVPISVGFTNIIPYTARHIKHLTIDSSSEVVRQTCLDNMIEGSFTEIQSMKMTSRSTQNLRSHLPTISQAFLATRNTLTSLNFDFSSNNNAIALADVLVGCRSVTTLVYVTECSMSSMIGDLSTSKKHHSLASIQLKAKPVIGSDIKMIIERCPKLRRLVMYGFKDDTMTVVNTIKTCTLLEILGYNSWGPVSDLQEPFSRPPGLREIYIDGYENPVDHTLSLLHNNMKTLEIVDATIPDSSQSQLEQLYTAYPGFKFEKLTSLSFFAIDSGVQSFMLRSIPKDTILTLLRIHCMNDMNEMVNIISKYPPPDELYIDYCNKTYDSSSSSIRLFKRYAELSESQRSLRTITLQSCGSAITDSTLAFLTSIKTLQEVHLSDPKCVTNQGVTTFLDKMKWQLTAIHLNKIEIITDSHIATLGKFDRLKQLAVKQLLNITDQGIHNMLDEGCHSLEELIVMDCHSITEKSIMRAKKLVKTVVYRT